MLHRKAFILCCVFFFLGNFREHWSFADDSCGLSFSTSNVTLVWSTSLTTQQIPLTINKEKNSTCAYFITFSKGSAGSYSRRMSSGPNTLNYQVYREVSLTNLLKEIPEASTDSVVSGNFGNGRNQTQTAYYFLTIPYTDATSPTLKPSGTYNDSLVLKLFQGRIDQVNTASAVPVDSRQVNIQTTVPKMTQLSLVSTGANFDPNSTVQNLSFGTLVSGASRSFDLRTLTNAGYSVTFSSQNNGVLKQANPGIATSIGYSVVVNGSGVNLGSSASNPVVVAAGSGQTGVAGALNPVVFQINSVADKMAGTYSDNITVTVSATE